MARETRPVERVLAFLDPLLSSRTGNPECYLLAEGVEELPGVGIFETMIQNPGRC